MCRLEPEVTFYGIFYYPRFLPPYLWFTARVWSCTESAFRWHGPVSGPASATSSRALLPPMDAAPLHEQLGRELTFSCASSMPVGYSIVERFISIAYVRRRSG